LPSGLRAGARALPSTALAEALRGALSTGADVPDRVWPVLAVWAKAAPALAVGLFRWDPGDLPAGPPAEWWPTGGRCPGAPPAPAPAAPGRRGRRSGGRARPIPLRHALGRRRRCGSA